MPLVPIWNTKTGERLLVHSVDAREIIQKHGDEYSNNDPLKLVPKAASLDDIGNKEPKQKVAPNNQSIRPINNVIYPRDEQGNLIVDEMDEQMLRDYLKKNKQPVHANARIETLRKNVIALVNSAE